MIKKLLAAGILSAALFSCNDPTSGGGVLSIEVTPESGATTFANTVTISWEADETANDGYEIQYSTTKENLENEIYYEGTSDSPFYEISDLNDNQAYYWRYRPIISSTDSTYGNWSTIYNFTVTEIDSENTNKINDVYELAYLANTSSLWSYSYEQTSDLDLTDVSLTPIGNSTTKFTGSYDGGGYAITNLTIDSTADYQGMFGYSYYATLKDIHLESAEVSGGDLVGGLVGRLWAGTMSECSISGKVSGNEKVGGLAGAISGSSTVTSCYAVSTVSGSEDVGGFSGYCYAASRNILVISDCYDKCTITGTTSGAGYIGGFVGYPYNYMGSQSFTNCYSASTITGEDSTLYGFTQISSSGRLNNCFYDNTLFYSTVDSASGEETIYMKTKSTFTDAGWDFSGETANGTDYIWNQSANVNSGYPYLVNNPPRD